MLISTRPHPWFCLLRPLLPWQGATLFWVWISSSSSRSHIPTTKQLPARVFSSRTSVHVCLLHDLAGRRCTPAQWHCRASFCFSLPVPITLASQAQEGTFFPSSKPCLPSCTSGHESSLWWGVSSLRPHALPEESSTWEHSGKTEARLATTTAPLTTQPPHAGGHGFLSRRNPRHQEVLPEAPRQIQASVHSPVPVLVIFGPVVCNNCAILTCDFYRWPAVRISWGRMDHMPSLTCSCKHGTLSSLRDPCPGVRAGQGAPVPLPAWLMAGTSGLWPNPWARREPPTGLLASSPLPPAGEMASGATEWYLKKRTQVLPWPGVGLLLQATVSLSDKWAQSCRSVSRKKVQRVNVLSKFQKLLRLSKESSHDFFKKVIE